MRECGECTKCCEGSLLLTVRGKSVNKSNPCHFLSTLNKCGGCTIYEERPEVCKTFKCEWLVNPEIPEWMKPSLVNTIVINQDQADVHYFEVVETDGKIDSVVLNWIFLFALRNKINLKYTVNHEVNNFGSADFINYITNKNKIIA
jgi:hypothetical protein